MAREETIRSSDLGVILEPGKGVGPARLGMTREQLVDSGINLEDDSFRLGFDTSGRCKRIEVAVFNFRCPVLLQGYDLNNISKVETSQIFERLFGSPATDRKDLGIRCLKWEFGDDFFTFVEVAASKG